MDTSTKILIISIAALIIIVVVGAYLLEQYQYDNIDYFNSIPGTCLICENSDCTKNDIFPATYRETCIEYGVNRTGTRTEWFPDE